MIWQAICLNLDNPDSDIQVGMSKAYWQTIAFHEVVGNHSDMAIGDQHPCDNDVADKLTGAGH